MHLGIAFCVLLTTAGCTSKPTPAPEPAAPRADAAKAAEPPGPSGTTDPVESSKPPAAKPAIITVKFVTTTGTVAPEYWRSDTLTVSQTLATEHVVHSHYGDTLVEGKPGRISQAQYDALTKALEDANYTQASSTDKHPMPVGGGSSTLTVVTDKASYVFRGGSTSTFPPGIAAIFDGRKQYMPQ